MDPHKNLEDLDFADDDICLISHKLGDMQVESNTLAEEASKIGSSSGENRENGVDGGSLANNNSRQQLV